MSWHPGEHPENGRPPDPLSVETTIVPRSRDIGGFEVRRILPSARRRMVGPFIFLDQMGPTRFAAGTGIDVRPHPHIGLSTVTYLLEGSIVHRDSVGSLQTIRPGDVNWMTAGSGIVHSERSDPEIRKQAADLHGLQLWVALPARHEETAPGFRHYPQAELPTIEGDGAAARIVAGSAFGRTSPVATFSDLFLVDITLQPGARLALDPDYEERAAYLVEGDVAVDGTAFGAGQLLVIAPGRQVVMSSDRPARLVLLGGAPLEEPRHIWWNFVSSRRERIEQAKADWKRNRFGLPVPGESEFIPLPDGP